MPPLHSTLRLLDGSLTAWRATSIMEKKRINAPLPSHRSHGACTKVHSGREFRRQATETTHASLSHALGCRSSPPIECSLPLHRRSASLRLDPAGGRRGFGGERLCPRRPDTPYKSTGCGPLARSDPGCLFVSAFMLRYRGESSPLASSGGDSPVCRSRCPAALFIFDGRVFWHRNDLPSVWCYHRGGALVSA